MLIWEKFKKLWKYYLLQSFLASVVIFFIVLVVKDKYVVIASMGATAFICFAMPKAVSAQTRQVIGGHLIGLVCGALFSFTHLSGAVEYPIVVGVVIFLMVAFDMEHPPAVGSALAVTINEVDWSTAAAILISIIFITQCRYYLRKFLKDLV